MKECFQAMSRALLRPFRGGVSEASAEEKELAGVYQLALCLALCGLWFGQAAARVLSVLLAEVQAPAIRFGIGLLPFQVAAFAGAMAGLCLSRRLYGWRRLLALPQDADDGSDSNVARAVVKSVRTLLLLYPVLLVVNALSAWGCRRLGVPTPPQSLQVFAEQSPGIGFWLLAAVSVVILAPVTEEILFRLVAYRALRGAWPRAAAVLASVVFAGAHFTPQYVPGLFLVGMVLQRAFCEGGLRHAIVLHCLYNLVSLLLFLSAHAMGW
ncbi:MAG TPA: CPBP family intramembrane metalloprotease [Lentisphaeria bacterium]|nr:CPBP family intramembrane metalloprotease [Lentisphaeria bacterium]